MWGAAMDVGGWLRNLGLDKYEAVFRESGIDEQVLRHVTAEDLREIGVATVGDRRKLLAAIAELAAPSPSTEPRPPPSSAGPKTPEVSAERRPITVMFCDLVGSTTLAAKLDAEDWRNLVNAYLDEATKAVTGLGGHVLKRLGDGLMALFGYPRAQENDAERAERAALAIQRALADLNAKNSVKNVPALSARIGIESGPVVVEATGEVFGDAPNVAARVQAAAEPGSVLVAMNVQRQVAGLFVAEDQGARELKGVPVPVTLYRIVRASGAGPRGGWRALTPLVGRGEELEMLSRRWERARIGEGQLARIIGEPGIGKSRLIEEFRNGLGATPHTWVEWSSSQLLQNTPLHPIAEWGRHRFGADADAERRLADLEITLQLIGLDSAEYAPLIAPLVDIPLPPDCVPQLAPGELRRRQLGALATWIFAGARTQPIVLAFEDLHWADPTSLDLLRVLAERGGQAPFFIVATTRPEFHPSWDTRSHHTVISLAPLDSAQVCKMVSEIASRHAWSKDVVEGVGERTGGVPLFVEEVTRLLLERGEQGGVQAIPPTLQQSLAARLDRLGPARETAQIGAVLGRSFSYALLHSVAAVGDHSRLGVAAVADGAAALSERGYSEAGLQSALDRLAEVDILIPEGVGEQATYRFKHALIQDAAYDSLLKSRRQELHRRAAEILRNIPEPAAMEPEAIAHHFTQAGLDDLAVEWWGKAADQALRRSALVEAVAQLTRALAQIAALPSTPALRRKQIELQVALITPLLHVKGYAAPEAKEAVERARLLIEQAEALGERSEDPLLLFSVLYGFWVANYVAFNGDVCRDLAAQFLALAEKQEAIVPLMIGHRLMGTSLLYTGDIAQGGAQYDRALALYDPGEHRALAARFGQDVRVATLLYRSLALWILGYPTAALGDLSRAINDAREIGQAATLMYALGHAPLLHLLSGSFVLAATDAREVIALADEKSAFIWKGAATAFLGCTFAFSGETSNAVETIASGLAAFRATGSTLWTPLYLLGLARAHAQLGQFDDAWRAIGEATTTVVTTKEKWCEAELHRAAGEIALMSPKQDTAKAQAYFDRALALAKAQQAKSWELRAATSLARFWRDQGKREAARRLLAPVYGWFTEGFDTLDLKEAKALLDALE
jgi:class 3 adenylate cyclase/predicted ATPase